MRTISRYCSISWNPFLAATLRLRSRRHMPCTKPSSAKRICARHNSNIRFRAAVLSSFFPSAAFAALFLSRSNFYNFCRFFLRKQTCVMLFFLLGGKFFRLHIGGRLWLCRKFVPNMRYFLVSINAPRAFYRFRLPNKIEIGVSDCIVDFRLLRTLG